MTALTHMAAARPPGIADARVPCPLCGGLIHPVAGRCKHCKEDLSSYRAGRPQAATALPALLDRKPQNGTNSTNGHALATANALVQSFVPPAHPTQQPILPPRTTARSVQAQRPHSMWRSWPMLVIIVAAIAIVAATVIMVMPQDNETKRGTISKPPAPERMQTNPLPEQHGSIDPWAQPGTIPQTPDPQTPTQPPPQDPNDDIWGGLGAVPPSGGHGSAPPRGRGGGGSGLGGLYGGGGSDIMIHAFHRVCAKIRNCPDVEESFTLMCDMIPKPSSAPACKAMDKCLDNIDKLDCSSSQSASPHVLVYMMNECILAAQQC